MGKIGRNSVLRRFWPHECGAQKLPSHIAAPPKICQLYPSLAGMDPRGVLGVRTPPNKIWEVLGGENCEIFTIPS